MGSDELPIIPVGVKNAPFTLDLFARDCPPTQFVREFTVNGIEAIDAYRRRADSDYRGEIIWTVDPSYEQLGVQKLACINTGVGMSAAEMPEYLNDLVSSGKPQGLDRNYGIGATVSAAVGNAAGVIYASWQDGHGHGRTRPRQRRHVGNAAAPPSQRRRGSRGVGHRRASAN